MKTTSAKNILLMVALGFGQHGHSQDFVNLDFESTVVTFVSGNPHYVYASDAIPGWTAYLDGTVQSSIGYDTVSIGGAAIFLEDANNISPLPIQGSYSVYLEGISGIFPSNPTTASIGQTGTIPNTAQSLTFYGTPSRPLQVTFNGQPLDYLLTGSTANYNIYAADISNYAGQTDQLLFTAPFQTGVVLDNIQFSSSPVPEPSELALSAFGALLLGFRGWRKIA